MSNNTSGDHNAPSYNPRRCRRRQRMADWSDVIPEWREAAHGVRFALKVTVEAIRRTEAPE